MALTLGEVMARVISQMGDPQQQVFDGAEITNLGNDWLRKVAAKVPGAFWTTATITTVNGSRIYDLAGNWLRMQRVVYNDSYALPAVTVSQWHQLTSDFDQSGTPQVYYVQRTPAEGTSQVTARMGLWPVPTSAVGIRYWYEYSPAVVTSWTSRFPVPPGMDESAVPYICWQLKKKDREFVEADRYKREFDEGFIDLVRYMTERPDAHFQMQGDQGQPVESFARLDPSVFENP